MKTISVIVITLLCLMSIVYADQYLDSNLHVTGNVTADNIHLPAYIYRHTDSTIAVAGAGTWYNITFTHDGDIPGKRITHYYDNASNNTFYIQDTGIYRLSFGIAYNDSAALPSATVAIRIAQNDVEVNGSYWEKDTTKQNAIGSIHHSLLYEFTAGDEIKFQFTSSATSVQMMALGTYATHKDSASLSIHRID